MKLLYTKRSPYARKVRIVALEKQIPLEYLEEDLSNKSTRLLTANPLGKIPTLILDHGETLCDSPVICEFFDELKVRPRLIPPTIKKRMKILHISALADGLMDVAVAAYLEKSRHPDNFSVQFVKAQEETIRRSLKSFDEHIKELEKLALASITVASAIG